MLSSATLIWHEAALASVLLWVLNVGPAALPQTVCAAAAGTKIAVSVGSNQHLVAAVAARLQADPARADRDLHDLAERDRLVGAVARIRIHVDPAIDAAARGGVDGDRGVHLVGLVEQAQRAGPDRDDEARGRRLQRAFDDGLAEGGAGGRVGGVGLRRTRGIGRRQRAQRGRLRASRDRVRRAGSTSGTAVPRRPRARPRDAPAGAHDRRARA